MFRPKLPPARLIDNAIDHDDARAVFHWIQWWRPLKVTRQRAGSFRHPWDIIPRWNAKAKRWEIRVLPGLVNGQEVEVVSSDFTLDDLPTDTLARQTRATSGRPWLSESPWIPVPNRLLRPLGADTPIGAEAEAIPQYFIDQGVLDAESQTTSNTPFGLATNFGGTSEDRAKARKLMACDIVIEQPRTRLETVAQDGELVASLTTPSGLAASPRLVLRRESSDPFPIGSTLQEMIAAGVVDDGVDRRLIGTFYLMSPPGEPRLVPDGTWQAEPRNRVFWNLNHAVTAEIRDFAPLRLEFTAGSALAGGLGGALIDNQLGALAAADAGAAAFLGTGRIAGRFWMV